MSAKPITEEDFIAVGAPNDYTFPAWYSFLCFYFKDPKAHEQFQKDTGHPPYLVANNPIDRMIDAACGASESNREYILNFAKWMSEDWNKGFDESDDG